MPVKRTRKTPTARPRRIDLFEAMKGRQSVRRFTKEPVPKEKILAMVAAAMEAPSAGNVRNYRFLVVQSPELLARMRGIVDEILSRVTGKPSSGRTTYHNLFAAAPAAVCVLGTPYESATDRQLRAKDPDRYRVRRWQVNPGLQSIAAAVAQFLLAAHALGYGTCWMTGPLVAKAELESALSITPPEELLAVLALGVSDSVTPKPSREPAERITEFR